MSEILDGVRRIDAEVGGRPLCLFLFLGERDLLLDAGLASTVPDFVVPYLGSLGLGPQDLDLLVITHPDADHQGGAHALAAASPALEIACGALDRELVSDPDAIMALRCDAPIARITVSATTRRRPQRCARCAARRSRSTASSRLARRSTSAAAWSCT